MPLIIVESPTKARTFNRILKSTNTGKNDYFVFATMGHFRDLPFNKMAIDFEHDFKPDYQIMKNKEKIVTQLKKLAEENNEIILATDPDREGESIAYHAAYILDYAKENWPDIRLDSEKKVKRIVFHEITSRALMEALEHPGDLRIDLVKAQQARRILDRIVGYELSPLLWKKMGKNWLSAGRVQSVALRLVVEREKEIKAFKKEIYYQLYGLFSSDTKELKAKLTAKDDIPYEETIKLQLFAGDYQYSKTKISKELSESIKTDLQNDSFSISDIKESMQSKYPPPPFTTSLLQQEAFHKYGYSSKMTMKLAQDLYERGLITYHRTDSFNLSTQFVFRAKDYIEATYGKEYALEKPRGYRTKSRMAQEAHEAIRPTKLENDPKTTFGKKSSNKTKSSFAQHHQKLYDLIFKRAVSTQMKEASIKNIKIIITSKKGYEFTSEKHQVIFDGFLKLLNPDYVNNNKNALSMTKDNAVTISSVTTEESETKPPPRYNEASIIKILEEKGIGRPSTYAPIISLIQEKNYVEKDYRYFLPTNLGQAISNYLAESFPEVFNLDFTASMEDGLDNIAEGKENFIDLLKGFNSPFQKIITEKRKDTTTIDVEEEVDEKCDKCGSKMVVRFSRFGKFLACSKYPDCKNTKSFLKPIPNKNCPKCGGGIVVRFTKSKKRFYGCSNYPKCDFSAWILANVK